MQVLYFDTETFCETPIRNGTHRYAESAEILIAAWAMDDELFEEEGEIHVEDLTDDDGVGCLPISEALARAIREADKIVIHNSAFDTTVCALSTQVGVLPQDKIEDTMIRAMAHGLPGALGKLSDIYKLGDDAKGKEGHALIRLFCMPAPKNQKLRRRTKNTHPDEWQRFLDYAGSDIRSMRALRKKLPSWNYPGKPQGNHQHGFEYELWQLDQTINRRGFKVDMDLVDSSIAMLARLKKDQDAYIAKATDDEVQTANQRDKLLKHLLEQFGVDLPDMTKSTLERRINDENLPMPVRELLMVRLDAAMASTSKYDAIKRSVSADGRLRGTLQFAGAIRTSRWAGRLFQPQNLPRPTGWEAKQADEWIEDIKAGIGECVLENPNRAAAVALRGTIVAEEGRKLVAADLSNIEGRGLAWLAGEQWKLDAFRDYDAGIGPDLYKITAGRILGKHADDITGDERQLQGKVPELACGYQGAAGAFGTMAALYGLELTDDEVSRIVQQWRAANPAIKQFWYDLEQAARDATRWPGKVFHAGKISFTRTGEWLLMRLPSGRFLCYCQPAEVDHPKFEGQTSLSYLGVNSYTRRWERIHTYGGKLAENATQAMARDVLAYNMPAIEEAGFRIILTVHDEVITEPLDTDEYTTDRLCTLLAATPDWADSNLPLAASGFEAYRYRK